MSKFLGPIHTWLFNKIKLQNDLVNIIMNKFYAEEKLQNITSYLDNHYGKLPKGSLEDIIDESNIHGWLQEQIAIVEVRLAYLVTKILNDSNEKKDLIVKYAYDFGKEHALSDIKSARDAFQDIESCLLSGMPCDHVNMIISEDDDSIRWQETVDIHKKYWNMVNGDVKNFFYIRNALIEGMLENSQMEFIVYENANYEIRRG